MCHFPSTIRSLETAIPWRWERARVISTAHVPNCSTEAWLCAPVDQPPAPPATQEAKAPRPHGRQQRRTPPVTPRRRRTVERRPPERQRKRRGVVFSLPMQPRERQVGDLATHGFDTLSRRLCYPRRRSRDCDTQDWIPVVGGNVSHYLSPLGSSRQSERDPTGGPAAFAGVEEPSSTLEMNLMNPNRQNPPGAQTVVCF